MLLHPYTKMACLALVCHSDLADGQTEVSLRQRENAWEPFGARQ